MEPPMQMVVCHSYWIDTVPFLCNKSSILFNICNMKIIRLREFFLPSILRWCAMLSHFYSQFVITIADSYGKPYVIRVAFPCYKFHWRIYGLCKYLQRSSMRAYRIWWDWLQRLLTCKFVICNDDDWKFKWRYLPS